MLGRQMLTELRDVICCLTDQVMQKAGQYDPSGYFLIEVWIRLPLSIHEEQFLTWSNTILNFCRMYFTMI